MNDETSRAPHTPKPDPAGQLPAVISARRKELKLTQRQLADRLFVTDKAVSKWERGVGCPDIKTIPALAGALGISVSDLLCQMPAEGAPASPDAIVEHTLQYADKASQYKHRSVASAAVFILSITFIIAILTCIICEIAVSHTLGWSWYVISSCAYAWFLCVPLILLRKYRLIAALCSASLLTFPLLAVIEAVSGTAGWLFPIGLPCLLVSLVYAWIIVCLFTFTRINAWLLAAVASMLSIPLSLLVNSIVGSALKEPGADIWDVFSVLCMLLISAALLAIGLQRQRAKK